YVTFLNKLRADSFDAMVEGLARNGEPTAAEIEAIANYINVATGRGSIGTSADASASVLNAAFFAPRLVASRFQLLALHPLWRNTPAADGSKPTMRVRKMVAKEYGKFLAGIGTVI